MVILLRLPGELPTPSGPPALRLYGRPGCHLCDDARAVLARIAVDHVFLLQDVDIDSDDRLFKAYLERIPVVVLDGEELYDFFVDEADLRARLSNRPNHYSQDLG